MLTIYTGATQSQQLRNSVSRRNDVRIASRDDLAWLDSGTLLNWGGYDCPPVRSGVRLINRPEACALARDKVASSRLLAQWLPPTVWSVADLDQIEGEQIVTKQQFGQQGSGVRVISRANALQSDAPIFQTYIPHNQTFRLNMLGERVITAWRRRHGSFMTWRHIPHDVVYEAGAALQVVGLDYGGVDVLLDADAYRFYLLEVNSAPGIGEQTLGRLVAALNGEGLASQS